MANSKAKRKKRKYERTTSVGRVCKNLEKATKVLVFAIDRMETWEHSKDTFLLSSLAHSRAALQSLVASKEAVEKLLITNWAPPKKSMVVVFKEGEEVRIAEKYREKYLKIYVPAVIDNLHVSSTFDSGEIAVRHGSMPPFLVAKSHIERCPQEE